MKLYQMKVSHFCEKIRWALDFKKLPYTPVNLLPGMHVKVIRQLTMSRATSLPVLVDGENIIQNSSDILNYLEGLYPDRPFTPIDALERASALEWEFFADTELGPHVRRCCYHILLDHPSLLIPMLAQDGPWYGKVLLRVIFSKLVLSMRKAMKIDQAGFESSEASIDTAVAKLRSHFEGAFLTPDGDCRYIVGERFSRADLAVAALFAPLSRVEGYGIQWPSTMPEELLLFESKYSDLIQWVKQVYSQHRNGTLNSVGKMQAKRIVNERVVY